MATRNEAIWRWSLTVLWLPAPFTVGRAVADASADASAAVGGVAVGFVWGGWALALAASVLRRPHGLTAVRVLGLAALAAVVAASTWPNAADVNAAFVVLATSHAVVLAGVAHLGELGNAYVDALNYGNERRILLRPPVGLLIGAIPLAWAVLVVGAVAGPLLLAVGRWTIGVPVGIVGLAAAALAWRALTQLARRWVVFVPNGFVLHDSLATREPVLVPQREVAQLKPVRPEERAARLRADAARATAARAAGDKAVPPEPLDVTLGAAGVALEVTTHSPLEFVKRPGHLRRDAAAEAVQVRQIVFCPTRPGAVLAEAANRRIGKPAHVA